MFLALLKIYLKSVDHPYLKSLISTLVSFTLCVSPFLLIIVGEGVLHLIRIVLQWLPNFGWTWVAACIEWLLNVVTWLIENLSLIAMPLLIVLIGVVFVYFYLRRSPLKVMAASYVFKRVTEPLLVLHFSAWLVKWLIGHEAFYFLEQLLEVKGLQTFASGEMVLVTLAMWFMLTLAFNNQLYKIRKENAETGESAVMEKIRLVLLDWIENHQNNRSVVLNKVEN